jgi:hypothetical protein
MSSRIFEADEIGPRRRHGGKSLEDNGPARVAQSIPKSEPDTAFLAEITAAEWTPRRGVPTTGSMQVDIAAGEMATRGITVRAHDRERIQRSEVAIVDYVNSDRDLLMVSQFDDPGKLNVISVDDQVTQFGLVEGETVRGSSYWMKPRRVLECRQRLAKLYEAWGKTALFLTNE